MFAFYKKVLARRVNDLLMGVIALGVLVVAIEYIQIGSDITLGEAQLRNLVQRVALLAVVISFACYILVAYAAYWDATPVIEEEENVARFNELPASKVLAMFLLDVVQVALVACMVGALLVGDLTDLTGLRQENGAGEVPPSHKPLELTLGNYAFLFTLAFLWHGIVLFWYWLRGGVMSTQMMHFCFSLAYLGLLGVILFVRYRFEATQVWEWIATGAFAVLIWALFKLRGIEDLQRAAKNLRGAF